MIRRLAKERARAPLHTLRHLDRRHLQFRLLILRSPEAVVLASANLTSRELVTLANGCLILSRET